MTGVCPLCESVILEHHDTAFMQEQTVHVECVVDAPSESDSDASSASDWMQVPEQSEASGNVVEDISTNSEFSWIFWEAIGSILLARTFGV